MLPNSNSRTYCQVQSLQAIPKHKIFSTLWNQYYPHRFMVQCKSKSGVFFTLEVYFAYKQNIFFPTNFKFLKIQKHAFSLRQTTKVTVNGQNITITEQKLSSIKFLCYHSCQCCCCCCLDTSFTFFNIAFYSGGENNLIEGPTLSLLILLWLIS